MVDVTKNVGNQGRWRIFVQQVSQNYGNNTSRVRVVGRLYNDGLSRSWTGSSIDKYIRGDASWDGGGGIDVPSGGSQTLMDETFTISHDSNGYRKVTMRVYCGDTGTYTFGTPGWVEASLTLSRIPKVPDKPSTPSRSFTSPNKISLSWSAPDNNGASIAEYQVQYDDNSSYSSPSTVSSGTSRSKTVTGLAIGRTWYFRVRARNSQGWSSWSSSTSYGIPNIPAKIGGVTIDYTPATTMEINWGVPSNGGSTILRYEVQYADNSSFTDAKVRHVTTTYTVVNDLVVGRTWYFRVRAENAQGNGAFSDYKSYLVVCGPRVLVNGEWRNTVAYVKVNGVWRTAIPYVNVGGTYRVAGG